jgi:hypothetical protein
LQLSSEAALGYHALNPYAVGKARGLSLEIFAKLAEERIREAIERGEMDDLPGMGEPLRLEDASHLPPELRLAYKVLKNAGYTPPELDLRREICQMEDLLVGTPDEQTRYQALKRLNYLTMKLGTLRPASAILDGHHYAERIVDRLIKA